MRTHFTHKIFFLLGLLMVFMVGGVQAQNATVTQTEPVTHFQIIVTDAENESAQANIIHWFIDGEWLSNAGGEGIVLLGENATQVLFEKLDILKNDSRTEKFDLDKQGNVLKLSLRGVEVKDLNSVLVQSVYTAPTR